MTELRLHIPRNILPVANIGLRAVSLVARFALTMFMAKYLTLAEIGLFGLLYSATASAPALFGFGINFFLNRQIVRMPFDEALRRVRDRVAVSFVIVTVASVVMALLVTLGRTLSGANIAQLCFILVLEAVAFDIHYSLISLKRPLLANALLFVRSALWILPFIGVAYFDSQYRNLDALLSWWLGSVVVAFTILAWHVRKWPWCGLQKVGFDVTWFRQTLSKSKLIYFSDIGIVGTMFADRYVLGSQVGFEQVGVFVFFWTIANSVQVLVSTAVSQIVMPHMVDKHAEGGQIALRVLLKRKSVEAAAIGTILGILAAITIYLIVPYLEQRELSENIHLLLVLLVAAVMRSVSDVWNVALYSAGKDTAWAWINIFGMLAQLVTSFTGLYFGGMVGLAAASVIVAATQWYARVQALRVDNE